MKTFLSLFLAVAFTLTANAQAVIVVQNATETRTFQTLNAAVEAAVDGDNIYVPGGSFVVNALVINKRLNIIGAGHVPDSTRATGSTLVHGNIHFAPGSDFSTIQGIFFSNIVHLGHSTGGNVANILISRCNMEQLIFGSYSNSGNMGANNIHVKECIIRSVMYCNDSQNHVVDNCIIGQSVNNINGGFTFNNCIFLYNPGSNYNLYAVNAAIFNNSIFAETRRSGLIWSNSLSPSSFNHCIFAFAATEDYGTNYGAYFNNCIGNVPDILGLYTNVLVNKFDYTYDFHLAENSVAIGAGINGTDCGIYGGINPYKEGAVPMNPHIQAISIPSTTDGEGKLQISVKVKAQNN
jgi:hypothetical protein